jgi:hypothetical protein
MSTSLVLFQILVGFNSQLTRDSQCRLANSELGSVHLRTDWITNRLKRKGAVRLASNNFGPRLNELHYVERPCRSRIDDESDRKNEE